MTDESLFAAALAIADPAARAAYLDRHCADDPALRREVEGLLAAHDAGSPLDRPPADLGRTGAYVPEPGSRTAAPGDRVGPYKLLERVGDGGMGEVWVADQQEPISRRVALKLIKPGMDSRGVLARFEAERQALALMDHPNIAKVLDAGTTPDGRPFFVMELVKGVSITEFCDARRLTPRERLELFVPVCQAIQHAHTKGIIHRDIKPGNVMVALHDETPVPKVIDFGVAKAIGQRLTEKTLYTGFGVLVGTPAYMAPEQATLNQLDVDTRADVYALGVLLYELLAGSPPLEPERLRKAGLDEVLRIVREEEPPRPSQRLSTSQARATIAKTRQTDPARLSALMRGELDWVVMKALEKDRNRRYETANGLARDVQRYLGGDAVEACPPTLGYRLRKAYRRNRGAVWVAAGFVLLTYAGGTGVYLAYRAAVAAREREGLERQRAEDEWGRAQFNATDARRAADLAHARLYNSDLLRIQRAWDEQRYDVARDVLAGLAPDRIGGNDLRRFEWFYWARRLGAPTRIPTSELPVGALHHDAAFTPDGRRGVVLGHRPSAPEAPEASDDPPVTGTCCVFEPSSGRPVSTWKADLASRNLTCVAITSDGSRVAAGSAQGTLFVWDVVTGKEVYRLQAHQVQVMAARFDRAGKRLVTFGFQDRAVVWDAESGREVGRFGDGSDRVTAVDLSPDGERLALATWLSTTGKTEGRLSVWDIATRGEVFSAAVRGGVSALVFRPDGGQIATAVRQGTDESCELVFWDLAMKRSTVCPTPRFSPRVLCYNPDSTRLAAGDLGPVRVWDASRAEELQAAHGHRSQIRGLGFCSDGRRLLASGNDGILAWDLDRGDGVREFTGPVRGQRGWVTSVTFDPTGRLIATNYIERKTRVWNADTGKVEREPEAVTRKLIFSPDGTRLLTQPDRQRTLELWDAGLRERVASWTLPVKEHSRYNWFRDYTFSPDGRLIAVADENRVSLLDAATREAVREFTFAPPAEKNRVGMVSQVAFSPDGSLLAANHIGVVHVWRTRDWSEAGRFGSRREGSVTAFAFDPRGERLISADGDRLRILEAPTGRELLVVPGFKGSVTALAFLPGGERLVAHCPPRGGDREELLRVWETGLWQELLTLSAPAGSGNIAVSPDGRRIAVGGNDGRIRLWDATPVMEPNK